MQHQRRIQVTGAVVLIMGASLFLWAVFRPHADLQRIYGLLLGLLGQVAGMAMLLLAERIHLPSPPRIAPGKTAAVLGALALLIGIGVAILVVRDPAPPSPGGQAVLRTTIPAGAKLECRQALMRMGVRLHPRLRVPRRAFQLVSCHDPNSMIPPIPELGPPPRPTILLLYAMKGERESQDLSALYADGGFSIRLVGADVALKTMESQNPSSGTQQVRLAGRDGWLSWRDERRWWASDPPSAVATLIEWHVRTSPLPLSATLYGYFDRRLALGLARDVAEALS